MEALIHAFARFLRVLLAFTGWFLHGGVLLHCKGTWYSLIEQKDQNAESHMQGKYS